MPDASAIKRIPLIAWFLGFGILDLGAALVLAYVFRVNDSPVFLYLLPSLALYGGKPGGPSLGFLDFLILFGGSFVLYGLLGVLFGLFVRYVISSQSPD